MRLNSCLNFVLLFLTARAQDVSIVAVKQAFKDAHIPSDLKINFGPTALLEVVLPQTSAVPIIVRTGIQLPRNEFSRYTVDTANPPVFNLVDLSDPTGKKGASPGPFVIAAVDPDAPTPTNTSHAQVRHFLGGDFFARKLELSGGGVITTPLLSNTSAALSEWRQPTPTGGNHRYIFLAFNQPEGFNKQAFVNSTTPIQNWNIETFAHEVGLGDPIAGTFMMVANPDNP